jgi:hypothetical protein
MMTNGPAATVGEILEVSFPRPRRRFGLLSRPEYERLRDSLITFLEDRADLRPQAGAALKLAPVPLRPNGATGSAKLPISDEERLVIERFTGFNRFRAKYRQSDLIENKHEAKASR